MENPEIDKYSGNKCWYNDHYELHREDGPAIEYPDGTKFWYINGLIHREDGPACEHADGHKSWYQHGKLHRIDGAAYITNTGHFQYWVNDKRYDSLEEGLMNQALE